ncbi:MAG TPA: peptidoglycan DD-metalloendopeptidase family protein [Pseudonocardiaceae bacterium]
MPITTPFRLLVLSATTLCGTALSVGPAAVPIIPGRPDEVVHLAAAATSRSRPVFGWPLTGPPPVVRPFQAPQHPYGRGHRGVDLAAADGQPVLAAGDGTVLFAGSVAGREVVSVEHTGGLRTTYEPLSPTVSTGQRVRRGQVIGHVRPHHPGCTAPGEPPVCLHWGLRRGQVYLDPLLLVRPARLRLLPWPERHPSSTGAVSPRSARRAWSAAAARPGCEADTPGIR